MRAQRGPPPVDGATNRGAELPPRIDHWTGTLQLVADPPRLILTDAGHRRPVQAVAIGDQPIVMGRGPQADLQLFERRASWMHCQLRRDGKRIELRDLESREGTCVNGQRVLRVVLRHGDRIHVGATCLEVLIPSDQQVCWRPHCSTCLYPCGDTPR